MSTNTQQDKYGKAREVETATWKAQTATQKQEAQVTRSLYSLEHIYEDDIV